MFAKTHAGLEGFPHLRGDVPNSRYFASVCSLFSPLAWGCTGDSFENLTLVGVFPTCVGMYRALTLRAISSAGFSPLAWGCTEVRHVRHRGVVVFPTCVGMYRAEAFGLTGRKCFPHLRGDVPFPC